MRIGYKINKQLDTRLKNVGDRKKVNFVRNSKVSRSATHLYYLQCVCSIYKSKEEDFK